MHDQIREQREINQRLGHLADRVESSMAPPAWERCPFKGDHVSKSFIFLVYFMLVLQIVTSGLLLYHFVL